MLTTAEIQTELDRVTYKPGWSFRVYDGRWEGQHIAITVCLPNSYRADEPLVLDVHSPMPPLRDTSHLHEWLMWRLGRIEIHELREFYRVDGVCVNDPHAEHAGRDRLDYIPQNTI